jgi:hypothetical protein
LKTIPGRVTVTIRPPVDQPLVAGVDLQQRRPAIRAARLAHTEALTTP